MAEFCCFDRFVLDVDEFVVDDDVVVDDDFVAAKCATIAVEAEREASTSDIYKYEK